MAIARGELWFAPGIPMAVVALDDPQRLLDAFVHRVRGFFLEPAEHLKSIEPNENSLFPTALLAAACIEFLARIDPHPAQRPDYIAAWLEANIPEFQQQISHRSAAAHFEAHFRNGIAHRGYVSALGRLGDIDGVVVVDDDVMTLNPFLLLREISAWLDRFANLLRSGQRDIRAFQHRVNELFEREVREARDEASAV